ncbi:MAG: hypothetical protein Q4Q06_08040, partial [Bacteroidota bacterium]|nr:hypothetical protein [Bacteroidota bacterium]
MIYIKGRRTKKETLEKKFPNAKVLDITSRSKYKRLRILSPFYPHGNIPVPFTEGITATCVEAIWQGLKVFKNADVDVSLFKNDSMRHLKRHVKKYGRVLGHRKGVYGKELLDYYHARMLIYLPTYKWVLDNVREVHELVEKIKELSKKQDIVFLDYNTNEDLNSKKALSHAALLKKYIEGNYPE